ncbi:MAG: flagellar export protein FliJ [Nitrosomonadales bacterium]|nr:flagellar export protein FliJ [Nitrosomonadales bacterium]
MDKIFPLQPLVHLAQKKNDDAARKLGQLNQQQQAAQSKLDTLLQYRKDYQTRFQEAVQNGMNQTDLNNFQNFIQRLDDAIAQQRNATEHARTSTQIGRNELQDTQRKMKSFDTLAQRYIENEKKLEAKIEQRQQDEFAGRNATIKATMAQDES